MAQLKAQVNALLTGVSSGQKVEGCVAEEIFPQIKSAQYSGLLGKYGTAHMRIENSVKGGRGKYRRVEARQYTTQQFLIEGHGLEGMVTKEDYANYSEVFDAEKDETIGISNMLLLEKEKLVADTLGNASVITNNVILSGTSKWNDFLNSDPLANLVGAGAATIGAVGKQADTAVMDIAVFNAIKFHPAFLKSLGYTQQRPGGITESELASILGVRKLKIASARYEAAKEGQPSNLQPVWGKNIVLMVSPDRAEPFQISTGYFVVPEGSTPRKTYTQPIFNPPGATAILVEDEYDLILANASAAYLIKDVI